MKKWQYISTHEGDFRPERRKLQDTIDKNGVRVISECPPGMISHIWRAKGPNYTVWAYPWESWLNILGLQGWEVCGSGVIGGKYPVITALLKRGLKEESEEE